MSSQILLSSLSLRNFATFENQVVNFGNGFNGIIGETGSGKSLILDAFELVLGQRADKKMIRKGSDSAIVEGTFTTSSKEVHDYFEGLGYPIEDNQIVIKRIIDKNGKSKAFLNFLTCPVSALSKFAKNFIDLVGQFENQKLLSAEYQGKLLDTFAGNQDLSEQYQESFSSLQKMRIELDTLKEQQKNSERQKDYLLFQLKEFENIDFTEEREGFLISQKELSLNREEALKAKARVLDLLNESDYSMLSTLGKLQNELSTLEGHLDSESLALFHDLKDKCDDFSFTMSKLDLESSGEEDLEDILSELDRFQKLKRKYHLETEELKKKKEEFEQELHELSLLDDKVIKLQRKIETTENGCYLMAKDLRKKRLPRAKDLSQKMSLSLKKLNMEGSTFKVQLIESEKLHHFGIDRVEFMVETNQGEGFYKISDVASGGELSRILLSLRQLVSSNDSISVFFFDEIDTGIGGETAKKIGEALKEVSIASQVIAITHLPQIAKLLNHMVYVDKKTVMVDGKARTYSFVKDSESLKKEEVIQTLAGL